MYIKQLTIHNFKSFKDVTIHFNQDLNVFTGKNNNGKTTMLEALSLWHECFTKLLTQAKSKEKNYRKGDWILGPTYNKYFPFDQVNSVRSPNFEDIFYQRDKRNKIYLCAALANSEGEELYLGFNVGQSGLNYVIELDGFTRYNFEDFNRFFNSFPNPIGLFYASPVSAIKQVEEFATDPQIRDSILRRESATVLRNRLYKLLKGADVRSYNDFQQDLSYVLFNSETSIELSSPSNISQDTRVIVNFKLGSKDTEKDIALLGSGSLQAIELLLNLYQPGEIQKDFNIILLDEPDSHIHRDIQQRLLNVMTKFSEQKNNQIFLSTHNESLVRNAAHHQLFHLDGNHKAEIWSIDKAQTSRIQPRFKGIYPSEINPIMRSIGSISGLDFINAMEADRLVFVEGEDDARYINVLLKQKSGAKKKYMFWVLGGISEVFENIIAYKQVFSSINNGKNLWEKSALIFDKDFLTINHKDILSEKFEEKAGIKTYVWNAYTFESTIFSNLEKFANLIALWIEKASGRKVEKPDFISAVTVEYEGVKDQLQARQTAKFIEECCHRYKNVRDKSHALFGNPYFITETDIQLQTLVRENFEANISTGDYFKLMTKLDVELVIDKLVKPYGLTFSVETDFIELIKLVNKSLWFDEWDFINTL